MHYCQLIDLSVYFEKMETREITFDSQKLSVIMITLIIPFFIGGEKLFDLIWEGEPGLLQLKVPTWMKYAAVLIAVVLHELIHGLVFARYAATGFKSVKFGASLKMGAVYCHCKDPVKVKHYRRAGIAPLIILGLVPLAFALITGVHWINTFGLLMTIAGFGDLMIWFKLLRFDKEMMIRDHPEKIGFIIDK
jgi:hypothetical protein